MAPGIIPVLEHPDFFIFNKPAGASFHSENGTGFFSSLCQHFPEETLFPVHRLDKMTSGLLLVSRNKSAASEFSRLFEGQLIQKTYLALSDKKPRKKQGTVTGDMHKTRGGSWKLCRTTNQPAVTRFTSEHLGGQLRLFTLRPATGRTHQLRVMMKSLGSPIIGDERYGGTTADRGYLHATALTFDWHGEKIGCVLLPDEGILFKAVTATSFHLPEASAESAC